MRCVYCMPEDMTFRPNAELMQDDEILLFTRLFATLGFHKIRLTGGEPLMRKKLPELVASIKAIKGVEEVVMTTNGTLLKKYAQPLFEAGLSRLNISLDTLKAERFHTLTRRDRLQAVLDGIAEAKKYAFESIKLNAVIMRGMNDDEIVPLTDFALENGLDISFIEEMPLGEVGYDRSVTFLASADIKNAIEKKHVLVSSNYKTGGPAVYSAIEGYKSRIGFISPHTNNFCSDCNRVRITAVGRLLLCLGNENSQDLRTVIRNGCSDDELRDTLISALKLKPEKHHFDLAEEVQILRFMSHTGG
ncbi:MAG: GTP 3',8-cyclase MoaA [Oleispira antarctica]|nr:GTP 3',8-cyclase MoaA [Oleispira antarctica]MBQ0792047.1 GTP 3',8-cyclase MoaA [Oleispira antarctica]